MSEQLDKQWAVQLSGMSHKQVFGAVLGHLAEREASPGYRDLAVVVSDYGRRLGLECFRELEPDGYVECGIAEQNQIEVASALANEGFRTFAPSYATFITSRVADQARVCLGMMASPVALVGVGCGCESGPLGASHMALEDVALMRSIPGIEVWAPIDNLDFASALASLAASPRPAYVRMNDGDGKLLLDSDKFTFLADKAPAVSRVLLACENPQVTLVTMGTIASRVLEAGRLLEDQGVACRVVAVSRVKPLVLDEQVLGGRLIVSVEEHSLVGGLGSAMAGLLAGSKGAPALLSLGMPDRYFDADLRDALLERAGLTAEAIAASTQMRLGELPN